MFFFDPVDHLLFDSLTSKAAQDTVAACSTPTSDDTTGQAPIGYESAMPAAVAAAFDQPAYM